MNRKKLLHRYAFTPNSHAIPGCDADSRSLFLSGSMLTKELSKAQRVQPSFIEPMQVSLVRELPDGDAWTYEAKLDGYRYLAAKRSSGVVLWSRRGNGLTHRFPEIARACDKLPAGTLIDWEVIVVDENGRCAFNALQHSRPKGQIQLKHSTC